jgi:hypothetical protein
MLALNNRTPFAAERCFMRDKTGADHWVVAVKATYALHPDGALSLADEQLAPQFAPVYWGEPGISSIRYESDLTLPKPATDVLLNACAHAPRGRAVTELEVRLRFGPVDKTLRVCGPHHFRRRVWGVQADAPAHFTTLPLRYEVAYGGMDTQDADPSRHRADMRNPVGTGVAFDRSTLAGRPAPSVVYPGGDVEKAGPAGFGAIASYWSPRLEQGGTYDAEWSASQRPLLPLDWQDSCLLCAPPDQRVPGHLRGDEVIALTHLSPRAELRLQLPRTVLGFNTHFGAKVQAHRGRLVTVVIEPDDARLVMVWQTALKVPLRRIDELDQTDIFVKRLVS